ncbi:hypothetical protein PR202_ga13268 [Eleusine coracana subsp. coracana]|uniref:Uncharacterized protein n=1 Tax=Eleusine coracana subsp. coracana TaxID=191504 RepID=A0AAV5CE88_ELECO|nr:hypothetical protein PR202_ga13268 [Eleusine coracana subsp. coracana]
MVAGMVLAVPNGVKGGVAATAMADSPKSVLEDEKLSDANNGDDCLATEASKQDEKAADFVDASSNLPVDLEAKNGDASLITEAMKKEEGQLEAVRVKAEEEEEARKREEGAKLAFDPEARYSKLDELLTKTQLFSEFLLEKMDAIADKRAKTAVAAMLTRSHEERLADDCTLSEEERWEKEQASLVPLLTGGKLKSYQIKGVKWLISLWQNGLNGILADQMGLGKTIQTIAFLVHLKGKGMHGPYMIIAPLSTLSNWVNEIFSSLNVKALGFRFTPSLASIIYHGDKAARAEIRRKFLPKTASPDFPIVVTSYEMAMSDARFLAHHKWKYVVVDDENAPMAPCSIHMSLTGNSDIDGLWFDFSAKASEEQQEETEEKRRVHVVSKLHAILRPFLLRRMKEDVEQMLPRKKEIIIYANMTEHQKRIQDHLVKKTFDVYLNEESDIGLYPPVDKLLEQCGKFQLLDRLLNSLLSRKHKVLIFSQWTKILDLLEYYLDSKGIGVCRIDGSVKLEERRRQIAEFNDLNSSLNVFILSTRAGGLGINLTSADTCILYDSDWGRIIKKAFGKLKLEHVVIGKGQFEQNSAKPNVLDEAELLALLRDEQAEEDRMIQTDISDDDLLKADGPERPVRSAWCGRCCPPYASERPRLGGRRAHEERRWNALVSHQLRAPALYFGAPFACRSTSVIWLTVRCFLAAKQAIFCIYGP